MKTALHIQLGFMLGLTGLSAFADNFDDFVRSRASGNPYIQRCLTEHASAATIETIYPDFGGKKDDSDPNDNLDRLICAENVNAAGDDKPLWWPVNYSVKIENGMIVLGARIYFERKLAKKGPLAHLSEKARLDQIEERMNSLIPQIQGFWARRGVRFELEFHYDERMPDRRADDIANGIELWDSIDRTQRDQWTAFGTTLKNSNAGQICVRALHEKGHVMGLPDKGVPSLASCKYIERLDPAISRDIMDKIHRIAEDASCETAMLHPEDLEKVLKPMCGETTAKELTAMIAMEQAMTANALSRQPGQNVNPLYPSAQ